MIFLLLFKFNYDMFDLLLMGLFLFVVNLVRHSIFVF